MNYNSTRKLSRDFHLRRQRCTMPLSQRRFSTSAMTRPCLLSIKMSLSRRCHLKRKRPISAMFMRRHGIVSAVATIQSSCISSLSKQAATQPSDFPPIYRWFAVPPANLVHLSIGSVYVYSMWTPSITKAVGVIASAPTDWTHSQILPVFSCAAMSLGITTHYFGSWVENVGPRLAGTIGSIFWSLGLITTGFGVYCHQLPIVYLGYGVLGGIGWGLMYLAPVTTVMKWFPDRRGLATGIALSAFGMGAAIAPAIIHTTMDFFAIAPDYIGPISSTISTDAVNMNSLVELTTLSDGSQVVAESSPVGVAGQPVVVATESDIAKVHNMATGAGAYVVGSGDTGVAKTFASLGIGYGLVGLLGSRYMILPNSKWTPNGPIADQDSDDNNSVSAVNSNDIGLPTSYVTSSTIQFPLLWLSVFGNATGGLALLSSSKLMITDIWSSISPELVTSSFATGYVSTLGIGMAAGRFGWSTLSDYFGRQNTYAIFGLGVPIVGLAPYLTHTAAAISLTDASNGVIASQDVLRYLTAFYGGSVLAITFYGGIFSTLPAYIADLFGQKHAGSIHGKLLTAWAASAVVGPMGLAYLRSHSVSNAIQDLLDKVEDPAAFENAFGCTLQDTESIERLIDAKTLSIGRLMELMPETTVDPTPFIYDTTCYAAAGLMGVAFLANMAIRPLDFVNIAKRLDAEKSVSS